MREKASHHLNIVITGTQKGLGKAISLALSSANISVVGGQLHGPSKLMVEHAATPGSGAIYSLECDITDQDAVQGLWNTAHETLGSVDVWINNAGIALTGEPLDTLNPEKLRQMFEVNVLGTMNATRIAMAGMADQGFGAIWNILGAGWDGKPVPGMNGYAASKSALAFITKALASEIEDEPYTIGSIVPGLVLTEGFFRENPHILTKPSERDGIVNIIGDHPATIAAWIAREITRPAQNGDTLIWLTPEKIAERSTMFPARDILSVYR